MTWLSKKKIQDSYAPVLAFYVADNSLCLKECLEINCTMFSYRRAIGNDECKLYTIAYDETKTETADWTTLHIRVCKSTGNKSAPSTCILWLLAFFKTICS